MPRERKAPSKAARGTSPAETFETLVARPPQTPEEFAQGTFFQASEGGCARCNFTGYRGRSGIYELMMIDEAVRALILKNADSNTIKKAAVATQGMALLREDGVKKAARGLTTLEEVMRVTEENVV